MAITRFVTGKNNAIIAVTRFRGKPSFPCRSWGNPRPQDGDEWEVEVEGMNRDETVVFLRPVRRISTEASRAADEQAAREKERMREERHAVEREERLAMLRGIYTDEAVSREAGMRVEVTVRYHVGSFLVHAHAVDYGIESLGVNGMISVPDKPKPISLLVQSLLDDLRRYNASQQRESLWAEVERVTGMSLDLRLNVRVQIQFGKMTVADATAYMLRVKSNMAAIRRLMNKGWDVARDTTNETLAVTAKDEWDWVHMSMVLPAVTVTWAMTLVEIDAPLYSGDDLTKHQQRATYTKKVLRPRPYVVVPHGLDVVSAEEAMREVSKELYHRYICYLAMDTYIQMTTKP